MFIFVNTFYNNYVIIAKYKRFDGGGSDVI